MKLIPKDALVAEIERKMEERDNSRDEAIWNNELWSETEYSYRDREDEAIIDLIDTLEVKEVDLEKAIDDYIYTHNGRKRLALELNWKYCNLTLKGGDEIIKFAKHFFELGMQQSKNDNNNEEKK